VTAEDLYFPLTVKSIHPETDQAKSFVFSPDATHEAEFRYLSGQFLTFRIPLESGAIERSYSLSSAPGFDSGLMVCVKRVADGAGSNWFNDSLQVGSRIESKKPAGRFILDHGDSSVLLLAGGSGITPCISLIKQALLHSRRNIRLIYVNTGRSAIIYADMLENLAGRYPERFSLTHWLDEESGLIGPQDIVSLTRDCAGASCYICGPDRLMTMAEQTLDDLPSVAASIMLERFASPRDGSEDDTPGGMEKSSSVNAPTDYRLKLDNVVHRVPLGAGGSLLQAALDTGLDVPHSCTEGHCGACMGKLCEGKVSMSSTRALSKRNLERGYILLCQSRPSAAEPLLIDMDF
jgi:3-ketosteroid 9alpha-monooxygenase subunit B